MMNREPLQLHYDFNIANIKKIILGTNESPGGNHTLDIELELLHTL